jgi:molecular chaperone GrpE
MTDDMKGRDVETEEAAEMDEAVGAAAAAEAETSASDAPESVDATGSPGPAADDVAVAELRDELDSLNDRHLRLAAEFDNYRKRNERERRSLATRMQSDLVASLLDVLDDLQRVEETVEDTTAEAVVEGVRLVEKKFMAVLEAAGLEEIDAEGRPFDPEVMEALMTVATDEPEKDGQVGDVFQRGYGFRDVLVRPARVSVLQYDDSE